MLQPIDRKLIQLLPAQAGCPIVTAAARVPTIQPADKTKRFASGWGRSAAVAVESCAFEMAERLSAQINNDEEFRRSTIDMLGDAVAPPEIMLIGDDQYAAGIPGLPGSWRRDIAIDWIQATVALSSAACWLPAGLCFLGHARDRDSGLLPADSNGLAAGCSREDAAVRAFVELVERDAVAIWWYNRLPRPRVMPADLGDDLVSDYARWCDDRHRPLRLIDLTHDFGIAVIAAVTHDAEGRAIALGFGTSGGFGGAGSMAMAARHAIGELTLFEGNIAFIERRAAKHGDQNMAPEALRLLHWWREGRMTTCPHLADGPIGSPSTTTMTLDLAACHDLCHQHGLSLFALDLTRSVLDTPVVRVVVPGLRPMAPRFASGRLYDVPVQCGWLPRPLLSIDLNPTAMMF